MRCKAGVSMLRDGCDCCYMCARQAGDMCNYKDRCDEARSLYCDFRGSGSGVGGGDWGYCRAKAARPCEVDGKVHKDGEEFKLNCSLLCSCQNGQYACSTLCPQELRSPSTSHCRDPQLVSVGGRCCKEWVCPHPQSMASPEDEFQPTHSTESPVTSTCRRETTSWSACSVSCGMGVSVRVTNDNADCRPHKQRRLCLVRPCELDDKHFTGGRCRHSRRQETLVNFRYDNCESVRGFRPKYCGSCRRGQCCVPHKTKTISVEFRCGGSDEPVWHRWMWVKNCKCRDESCL
ncbi:hypothetical protein NP493_88g01029 [Ridgeia piscesae]|uniref:Connective tissue growth factor n=1 Tax=Ridgeia piscesae TaxID=27915 RepID=A0AAD9P8G6_RIDPI|nr:hypothetical protein NP493_88g01029 [Ridgeia piscesae]